MPNVLDVLAAKASGKAEKPLVHTTMVARDGKYFIEIPARLSQDMLKVSSTGKSLIVTFRVDGRKGDYPFMIEAPDGKVTTLDAGGFNINLTL